MWNIVRKIPNFKGKIRLFKFFNLTPSESVLLKLGKIKILVPNTIEPIGYSLLIDGVYEKETIQFIVKNVPKNGVFVDVGANIGAISIFVAKMRPDIKVISFEPSFYNYGFLRLNKQLNNLSNITLVNAAVHLDGGKEISFFNNKVRNGGSSLCNDDKSQIEEIVKTVNLDDYFQLNNLVVNLIKVDVEGFELTVLKSAQKHLNTTQPIIVFEFEDWAEKRSGDRIGSSQKFLLDSGYNLFSMNGNQVHQILETGSHMLVAKKNS